MKFKIRSILLSTIVFLNMQHLIAAEMREWKSNKGSKVQAELLFAGETLIVLKTDKGKEISIPISSLGVQERAYLKSLKEEPTAPEKREEKLLEPAKPEAEGKNIAEEKMVNEKSASVAKKDALETLADGKGKGFHAYYEGKKYIAKVTNKGHLIVYYKDETGKVDDRWRLVVRAKSMHRAKAGWRHFNYVKILNGNPAKADATEVKYTFLSDTDIKSEVIYEFFPNEFTTWTRSDEGKSTPEKVLHMMTHHFGTLDRVSKDKAYLKKMKFKRELVNGKKESFDFSENVRINGDTEECEISGPLFVKTKITIERAKDDDAKLTPSQYSNIPLSNGFSMNCIKEDCQTKKHKSENTTIYYK